MKKKKINTHSSNGIMVCDSIVMSVKKRRLNMRKIEAVAIGLAGYVSAIMVFLNMFSFNFNKTDFVIAAICFSALYITLSLIGKKAIWIVTATSVAAMLISYKFIETIAFGYKFVYNVIYRTSYHTEISYYKFLDAKLEEHDVTVFFIFCAWLLAVVIYLFTIYHPNAIPPLLVTFPILEVGLYNGINVSVFWGMLLVGYWLALFAMTAIDMGEYSGGTGGFVRKENLFFPKRQMRLKVTEKCGVYIILCVMLVSGVSVSVMKATHYKRSEKINEKRVDIRDAVNSFTMDDVSGSLSNITSAFGFTFRVQTHRLGNIDRLKYKNTTDLVVDFDRPFNGAVYLKEYNGAVYKDNEWTQLPDSVYNDELFRDFKKYSLYPQDFGGVFQNAIHRELSPYSSNSDQYSMTIDSKLKGNRSFAPYFTLSDGILEYDRDNTLTSKSNGKNKYSYMFCKVEPEMLSKVLGKSSRNAFSISLVEDMDGKQQLDNYCNDKSLLDNGDYLFIDTELAINDHTAYSYPKFVLAEMMQEDYEKFVHENYLQLPDNENMNEIREAFADILDRAQEGDSADRKFIILNALRERIAANSEYSLSPGRTPSNRDFVNYFLLENKKGYCIHYATSGVVLARMAGIPARYATGYVIVGNDFNDAKDSQTGHYIIDVKDTRSHAWTEVYLDGFGWIPFEFTAGYSENAIETAPVTTAEVTTTETTATTTSNSSDTRSTTSRNNSTNNSTNTTTAVTTATSTTETRPGIGGFFGHGGGAVPAFLKHTLRFIIVVAAVIAVVLLRRYLIIRIRNKRFNDGNISRRMGNIYAYTEKLLGLRDMHRGDMPYIEFAQFIEKNYGGILFKAGEFSELVNDALCAAFSNEPPHKARLEYHIKFNKALASKIYGKSSRIGKFYMKYVAVLID